MTLTEFLLARITEDEDVARSAAEESAPDWQHGEQYGACRVETVHEFGNPGYEYRIGITHDQEGLSDSVLPSAGDLIARYDPARVLAECEAKRRVVDWHENWPVLVQSQPTVDRVDPTDMQSFAFRASQQIAWQTEREYVTRFGSEPPTSPILRMLAAPYAEHPDYDASWSLDDAGVSR